MDFNDITISKDIDSLKTTDNNDIISDFERYNIELDFVEKCEDADGILHIKTVFSHTDIPESELWEIFLPNDGSQSLELLLNND